ncbi:MULTISPECIES: A24 family peptidase [unclassified Microbacterium]|uniref:prepilin peptidase n=1 Tax=unclassified Microbacterium TaxID=2609290 RepID=UPI000CFA8C9C|nr:MULTISPECIES: A24 family peptidase [unclassified Microbacterium]PQZ60436.1 prepilin peptidase [Microbacterium sp. MYb43]PQZ81862.1 prepilin peptidase [Microbacterium sp. MYb40]PRB22125.1 prepilin peptidase [Microbacterium sp. MYb54]PRB31310.1 prepilin peptidase [Microbacterium sp. MYb50]PRB69919.1 prepilin peptidase [Microbacterium sp. MYb24]
MDIRLALIALVHIALIGIGGWLIVIDARTHRLPNRIVLPTLACLIVLAVTDAVATGQGAALVRALIGMVILGGFYAVLRGMSRAGMGGGDVKLAAVIGLVLGWHGWQSLAIGAASAFVLGALYAIVLILLRRANGATRIAFGPWMIAGALLGVVLG